MTVTTLGLPRSFRRLATVLAATASLSLPMGVAATPPPGTTASLTTLFATDNSFAGNTFDVEVGQPVTVLGFEVNLGEPGSVNTVAVYYRPGTAAGAQDSSDGWTLLGTDTNVVSQGPNAMTEVRVGSLTLQPGQVYGFYVDVQSYPSASMLYTNGGPIEYTDGVMTVTTRDGKGNPAFTGSTFASRQWNGVIHYRLNNSSPVPVPVFGPLGLVLVSSLVGITGIVARRRWQRRG